MPGSYQTSVTPSRFLEENLCNDVVEGSDFGSEEYKLIRFSLIIDVLVEFGDSLFL